MKKIGLLSDTHGYVPARLLELFGECDEIWHAGDWGPIAVYDTLQLLKKPIRGVYGNIDGPPLRGMFKKNERFLCEGVDVLITHIGGYPGRYSLDIKQEIKQNPPQLFICGHSHILKVMRDPKSNNLLHINPGAAGNHGFHKVKTAVRFSLDKGSISNLEVIEFGPRSVIADTSS